MRDIVGDVGKRLGGGLEKTAWFVIQQFHVAFCARSWGAALQAQPTLAKGFGGARLVAWAGFPWQLEAPDSFIRMRRNCERNVWFRLHCTVGDV
jgi:hypothetical protein